MPDSIPPPATLTPHLAFIHYRKPQKDLHNYSLEGDTQTCNTFIKAGQASETMWTVKEPFLPVLTHRLSPTHSLTWPDASCVASRIPPRSAWFHSKFCQMCLWRTHGPCSSCLSRCYSLLRSVDSFSGSCFYVYVKANMARWLLSQKLNFKWMCWKKVQCLK